MTSIGLVLGAGGVVGGAYHAAAIAAIEQVTGWDARTADLIVGTSAGSGVAAGLRAGLSPQDHYRRAQDLPVSDEALALGGSFKEARLELPSRTVPRPLTFLRPTAPWLVAPAFLSPGPIRPGLLAGLAPRGTHDTTPLGDRIRSVSKGRWPAQPTWIVAVRLRDGKRTVFGREDIDVPDIGTAVQASSAVPGYFAPVHIGNHDYFDGGTFSASNADLVAPLGFDLVVVVSPMTATSDALDRSPANAFRVLAVRSLGREVEAIRKRGTKVLVLQPGRDDLEVMKGDLLAHESSAPVAQRAFASVTEHLGRADLADRLDVLRTAAPVS
jgi:NTE family protein